METAAGERATRVAAALTEPDSVTAMKVFTTSMSNRIDAGGGVSIVKFQQP